MQSADLIATVAEDILTLQELWHDKASNRMLRASSAILRRLLVDDSLIHALKAVGGSMLPMIEVQDTERLLSHLDVSRIQFATFGRAKVNGGEVFSCFYSTQALSVETMKKMKPHPDLPIVVSIADFCRATGIVVDGRRIQNRQIIQYVANKKGGIHFDSKREGKDAEAMRLLDKSLNFEVMGKPAVYLQLLSVGQALTANAEIASFAAKFAREE